MVLYTCVCLFTLVIQVFTQTWPIVEIEQGTIEGNRKTLRGLQYDEFLGIPYAGAPVGELRWQRPVPRASWGFLETKVKGPECPQTGPTDNASEDCLNLNVYVPGPVDSSNKFPVMVWVHGGGYALGSGSQYPGNDLAVTGEVIVVTINYRLGVAGFLSTEDENAPGNYGLWDIIFALEWVQTNIGSFGGDREAVTIFGQSAGGAAVSHIALALPARGLFRRVIPISGSAICPVGRSFLGKTQSRNLGIAFGCQFWDSSRLVECLRDQDADTLELYGQLTPVILDGNVARFSPTIDGPGGVVPVDQEVLMEQGANSDYDMLYIYMKDDGAAQVVTPTFNLAENPQFFDLYMRFEFNRYRNPGELTQLIYEVNPNLRSPDLQVRTRAAITGVTNYVYAESLHYEARQHAENTKTNGKKTYMGRMSFLPSWYQDRFAEFNVTAIHGDDISLIFGEDWILSYVGPDTVITADDRKMIDNMMMYLANFAYTGNPNDGPHKVEALWPEYDNQTQEMLIIDSELITDKVSPEENEAFNFYKYVFYPAAERSSLAITNIRQKRAIVSDLAEKWFQEKITNPHADFTTFMNEVILLKAKEIGAM